MSGKPLQELENEKGVRTAGPMVWMMAAHLDRPECDVDTVAHFSKDEESEPKELRMPQNINALLCFAEQYEVMKMKSSRPADLDSMGKV